jgi:hypothetical protein
MFNLYYTDTMDSLINEMSNHKIVTLCGSTKFKSSFEQANLLLTFANKIVLQPGCFAHADNITITYEQKIALDKLHFEKIDLSDCILVINENQYIGSSTRNEINYAVKTNKPIYYMFY